MFLPHDVETAIGDDFDRGRFPNNCCMARRIAHLVGVCRASPAAVIALDRAWDRRNNSQCDCVLYRNGGMLFWVTKKKKVDSLAELRNIDLGQFACYCSLATYSRYNSFEHHRPTYICVVGHIRATNGRRELAFARAHHTKNTGMSRHDSSQSSSPVVSWTKVLCVFESDRRIHSRSINM